MFEQRLHPPELRGTPNRIPAFPIYEWIRQLPTNKKIYLALWQHWDSKDLPPGYNIYIVSFHIEAVNIEWLRQQVQIVNAPIIVLHDGSHYDCEITGVEFVSFFYWHEQIRKIINWFGIQPRSMPTHKFGAICNRISQSKFLITTKLLESAKDQSLIALSDRIELANVHYWSSTGNAELDRLTQIFREKYLGKIIKIDDFDNKNSNATSITSNPWQPVLTNSAVYFSNESFHYSYMMFNDTSFIYPGPFLTEKTMKCLISGCTIVPVGQFETYKTLSKFGLQFDYDFDTSWDNDPGNSSRLHSVVNLIDDLNALDIEQLELNNREVNAYNQNCLVSGKFWNAVNAANEQAVEQIFELIAC